MKPQYNVPRKSCGFGYTTAFIVSALQLHMFYVMLVMWVVKLSPDIQIKSRFHCMCELLSVKPCYCD